MRSSSRELEINFTAAIVIAENFLVKIVAIFLVQNFSIAQIIENVWCHYVKKISTCILPDSKTQQNK